MKTLAITGSSGSGKTTISELFLRLDGTCVINTDKIAKEMAEKNSAYIDEIVLYFGRYILENSVKLNRKLLGTIIETDDEARMELNKITKKYIMPEIDKIIDENSNKKLIIVDVPILYENQLEVFFDKVLAVISNKDEQIRRICKRDGITIDKANSRLNIQYGNDFYQKQADYVINNYEKTLDELYKEVFSIYLDILR